MKDLPRHRKPSILPRICHGCIPCEQPTFNDQTDIIYLSKQKKGISSQNRLEIPSTVVLITPRYLSRASPQFHALP